MNCVQIIIMILMILVVFFYYSWYDFKVFITKALFDKREVYFKQMFKSIYKELFIGQLKNAGNYYENTSNF